MTFKPWHDYRDAIEDAVKANYESLTGTLINEAMHQPEIQWADDKIIECNDMGKPYSALDQTDAAIFLCKAGRQFGRGDWMNWAQRVMWPVFKEYPDGLRRPGNGGKTCWLHAQTSRDRNIPGGTLNKHLISARNCFDLGSLLDYDGDRATNIGEKAVLQLCKDEFPNLSTFLYKYNGEYKNKSWAYYAVDFNNKKQPYWLSNDPTKNGMYHIKDITVLWKIATERMVDFPTEAFTNDGTLKLMKEIYNKKCQDGGLYVDSVPATGGLFNRCREDTGPLTPACMEWLKQF